MPDVASHFGSVVANCSREPIGNSDREPVIGNPILQIAALKKMASKMAARAFSRCNKAQWLFRIWKVVMVIYIIIRVRSAFSLVASCVLLKYTRTDDVS